MSSEGRMLRASLTSTDAPNRVLDASVCLTDSRSGRLYLEAFTAMVTSGLAWWMPWTIAAL